MNLSVFPVCSPIGNGRCLHHTKCANPGKMPLVYWLPLQDAPATNAELSTWRHQFGDIINVALVTGKVSNIVVLDADNGSAVEYIKNKGIEDGPVVLTGRVGGKHFWLRHNGKEMKNFSHKVPGLDFRGDGGYVLMPGSKHSNGNFYRWLDNTEKLPIPNAPEWLIELLKPKENSIGYNDKGWIGNALLELKEGCRNDNLHRIAGWLRRYGATNSDVFELLKPHAIEAGLTLEELKILTESAGKYVPLIQESKQPRLIQENGEFIWVKD